MIIVYTTVGSKEDALKISKQLVGERLCACVNFFSTSSVFEWDGEMKVDDEHSMLIKTSLNFENIKERLKQMHPYETPCIIEISVENVNEDYAKWVDCFCKLRSN